MGTAMATVSKLLLLHLCLCSYHSLSAYAGDDPTYTTGSINTKAVCSESKATPSSTSGATLTLHHRHGPCSFDPSKETLTLEEILLSDQLRASSIQRKLSAGTKSTAADAEKLEATVPTTLGTAFQTLQYLINVSIGTPAVSQTMMIDTGSDISWVHCKPCSPCHSQVNSIFDPSKSTTYSPFPCSSTACVQLGNDSSADCSTSQQCQYVVRYGDGSNTTGTYSSDTLTLGPNVVTGFRFGCSRDASGFSDDMTAGLIGLGGGAQSLVSQTAATFGPAFSYCLPAPQAPSGFLTLGASSSGGSMSNFTTTRMFRISQIPTFYFVLLRGIRVGGRQVNVQPSVFAAGSVVDSGTIITRLPPTAYAAMSSAFRAGMTRYRRAKPVSLFDTCYDFGNLTTVSVPTIELVFDGGAVIDLDVDGIMILDSCLAFAANDDDSSFGLIGNVQQRTFEVLYDVGQSTMGFRAGAC